MKVVLMVLVGLAVNINSFSQRKENYFIWPVNSLTDKIEFVESVYLPEVDANTLFSNAKNFVSNTFRNERDSILFINDTLKSLMCQATFYMEVAELGERGKGYIYFTFSIKCNPSSYKYTLSNFEHFPVLKNGAVGGKLENEIATSGGVLFPTRYWDEQKAKCYYMVQNTIERLKESMNKTTTS